MANIDVERRTSRLVHRLGVPTETAVTVATDGHRGLLPYLVPLGRVLFAAIFLLSVPNHFSQSGIDYARSSGVPFAQLAVPLSGILALAGALSVILGYRVRIGATLLVLFLVPVTLFMHNFWAVPDAGMARLQQAMFMKNVAMLGGALLLIYFGAGPFSMDVRRARKAPTLLRPTGPAEQPH